VKSGGGETGLTVRLTDVSWLKESNIGLNFVPPNQTLDIGDRETIPIESFFVYRSHRLTYADVALIISFKPEFIPFWTRTKVFRFKTVSQADGTLRFQQQPPGDVLERYKQTLRLLDTLPTH
jgi:hypothetical protein